MGRLRTHLDFETRSLADLTKVGGDVYAQHESTAPLMLAFHTTGMASVDLIDFFDDPAYPKMRHPRCPAPILAAIERGDTIVAHNARFEQAIWYWICHTKWGWPWPTNWSCTAARARYWGLRASLEGCASDLEVVNQKSKAGEDYIKGKNSFCRPRKWKGAIKNGIIQHMWWEPYEQPAMWAEFKEYCRQDVRAEMDVDAILPDLPPFEQEIWELDFKINTRGLPVDLPSVRRAKEFSEHYTAKNIAAFEAITALRPTQRDRVLEYINQREEIADLGDLRSKTLKRITLTDLPQDLQDVINIRLETSKASIRKLEAMERRTDSDGVARGCLLYGGAHTMRWSSKGLQVQNFTRPDMDTLRAMFEYLEGPWWGQGMVGHNGGPPLDEMPQQPAWIFEAGLRFPRPLDALSKSMKGFIKAPDGTEIICGDYSQIEARVLAWLARCMWLLEAFGNGDDVYTRFAAQYMYNRVYEECIVYKNGKPKVKPQYAPERQKGKSAVLGCGFQVGGRGFQEYCDNIDLIITREEADSIVKAYRRAHPEVSDYDTGLWTRMERAASLAVGSEGKTVSLGSTGVTFHVHRLDAERYWLICTLPSGRHIAYYRPKVRLGQKFGRTAEILSFRTEWCGKSYREDTYGGKLTENVVQAIARDVCAIGAVNADKAGYPVRGLVHDEVITIPPVGFGSPDELVRIMCTLPAWITDCPVEAEGARMVRYGK